MQAFSVVECVKQNQYHNKFLQLIIRKKTHWGGGGILNTSLLPLSYGLIIRCDRAISNDHLLRLSIHIHHSAVFICYMRHMLITTSILVHLYRH